MTASMLIFWGALLWAGVVAVRVLTHSDQRQGVDRSSARRLLEERFARGEIDRQEFEERRSVLGAEARR